MNAGHALRVFPIRDISFFVLAERGPVQFSGAIRDANQLLGGQVGHR